MTLGFSRPARTLTTTRVPEDLALLLVHEAAHAVMFYALGFGLVKVALVRGEVPDFDGKFIVVSGVRCEERITKPVLRRIYAGVLDDETVAWGVTSAAGPAAERKLRLVMGLPLGMKTYAKGDHANIMKVARVLGKAGHDSRAYREEVWRQAQAAMEDPAVWNAVNALAGKLRRYWPTAEEVEAHGGWDIGVMRGPRARQIIEQAGVRPCERKHG